LPSGIGWADLSLENTVGREKDAYEADLHGEIKNTVVT